MVKAVQRIFLVGYALIVACFATAGFALVAFALFELWSGISPAAQVSVRDRFDAVLESIGLLTIAVVALELGQTILEEEVLREAQMSAPTRVRRFLSRFLVVVVVSLSIETLVAVFRFLHHNPEDLPRAATIGLAAAALLAAWGIFIRLNTKAEELEPEAMRKAQSEDRKLG